MHSVGLHCEVIEVNEHNDDDDDIPSNRGNFLDILDAFAKIDPILKEHLSNSKRNAKMTTWMVQNDIISCIAQFIRNRIKEIIARENYYAFIADGVTDRYANKEVLLVCLRYVNYLNGKPKIEEAFFDSVHIQGLTTGHNIAKHIIDVLSTNGIDIHGCRAQAYDGASAMSSNVRGASAVIKEHKAKAEYTHCRNHVINLAVAYACKNRIFQNMMDTITSTSDFYRNSPKRNQYFELFVTYHSKNLNISDSKRQKIIGLSRTRWVERHRAYESYFLLYEANIAVLESIVHPDQYEEFLAHLEETYGKKWTWDSETKVKAQGLFTASRKFGHIAAFSVALNALEPIKPLVTKLQKRNQDIFQGYHMIDDVIYRLKEMREDIDSEFHDWYEQAQKIADSVGVEPSTPRISKCRSRYRDN